MAATAGIGNRQTAIFYNYWIYLAIGFPFIFISFVGAGFRAAFETGGASAFMLGTIVVAFGECVIENSKDGFARFKAARGKERLGGYSALGLAFAFFWWNTYYVVADKAAVHASVNWVQVTVFLLAAAFLPAARFAFTDSKTRRMVPEIQAEVPVPDPVITTGEGD